MSPNRPRPPKVSADPSPSQVAAGDDRAVPALAAGGLVAAGFIAALVSLSLFAGIAALVGRDLTEQMDGAVLTWARRVQSPWLDAAAWAISLLGSEVLGVLLLGACVALLATQRWRWVIPLVAATAGAQVLNSVLKDLFQRTRPAPVTGLIPAQAFSFPSGHAMVAMAFYSFAAYLAWRSVPSPWRQCLVAGCAIVVALIGLARLYLGVHYLSDVVAGYVAGFLWAQSVILATEIVSHRHLPDG